MSDSEFIWKDLLTRSEISEWVSNRKEPAKLGTDSGCPGVYRFVFEKSRDGNCARRPFYVGESKNVADRIRWHFRPGNDDVERDRYGKIRMQSGWRVNGNILRSNGNFELHILTIKSRVNFYDVALTQDSFNDVFRRVLIENWAIVSSRDSDGFRPLNLQGNKRQRLF